VPNLNWKIEHRLAELEGADKKLLIPGREGYWLQEAFQTIEFRLDKSGAVVASESEVSFAAEPRQYSFASPFLIVLRKRGTPVPFFVMWVDNAELLCKPAD